MRSGKSIPNKVVVELGCELRESKSGMGSGRNSASGLLQSLEAIPD